MSNQGVTNPRGWLNEQESSTYPLRHDSNVPRAILCDLSIASPDNSVYVDSLWCSAGQASIVLHYSGGLFGAITLADVIPGQIYEHVSDVGSFTVVFGNAVRSVEFRNSSRLEIHPGCVHTTLNRSSALGITGTDSPDNPLKLTGTNDISVSRGFLDAANTLPALFLGLNTDTNGIDLHNDYLGPCDRRPVSLNCQGDQPIRSIASVPSDCCNTIYIELQGVTIRPLSNYCGVAVDADFTLEELCPPRELVGIVQKVSDDCETPSDDYLAESGDDSDEVDSTSGKPIDPPAGPSADDPPGSSDPLGSLTRPGGSADADADQPDIPGLTQVYTVYDIAMLYDSYNSVYGDSQQFDP